MMRLESNFASFIDLYDDNQFLDDKYQVGKMMVVKNDS